MELHVITQVELYEHSSNTRACDISVVVFILMRFPFFDPLSRAFQIENAQRMCGRNA